MVQQATVTITGFVGSDPTHFGNEDSQACSFRVGSTRSYFNANTNRWVDRPTTWITVKAYRTLAQHTLASIHKGEPVIIQGALHTEEWQQDGNKRTTIVVEASNIGHDLALGTSVFRRNSVQNTAEGVESEMSANAMSANAMSANEMLERELSVNEEFDNAAM